MNKKIFLLSFLCIFLLGFFLRFYELGMIPSSLNWDEVSWGYNGYSISKTGKDEHGVSYPLSFRAFGDFKQPVYVYLNSLSIAFFGLTAYAVRFPSAIIGTIGIIVVYFLVQELLRRDKLHQYYALTAMALFAISPWAIQFSRVAYEANVALVLVMLGVTLFIRGINTNKQSFLFLATIPFSLSMYTYHSEKIFTPLLIAALVVWSYKYFISRKRMATLLLILLMVLNIFWVIDARTTARGRSVLFTSSTTELLKNSVEQITYDRQHDDLIGELLHNRRVVFAKKFIGNYLAHFNPIFLFLKGDDPRHHAPETGVLYLVSLPFILLGIYYLIFNHFKRHWIIFAWFLLAPVLSALAISAPNASRSMIFLPTWDIFAAVGIVILISKYKTKRIPIILAVVMLFVCNFIYYTHQYFVHTNREYEKYWQYGYKQAIDYIVKSDFSRKNVYFKNDIEQGYMFYLFHTQYNPATYIARGGSKHIVEKCYSIDNIYFGSCSLDKESGTILVTSKVLSEKMYNNIKTISFSNGEDAVYIYEIKEH